MEKLTQDEIAEFAEKGRIFYLASRNQLDPKDYAAYYFYKRQEDDRLHALESTVKQDKRPKAAATSTRTATSAIAGFPLSSEEKKIKKEKKLTVDSSDAESVLSKASKKSAATDTALTSGSDAGSENSSVVGVSPSSAAAPTGVRSKSQPKLCKKAKRQLLIQQNLRNSQLLSLEEWCDSVVAWMKEKVEGLNKDLILFKLREKIHDSKTHQNGIDLVKDEEAARLKDEIYNMVYALFFEGKRICRAKGSNHKSLLAEKAMFFEGRKEFLQILNETIIFFYYISPASTQFYKEKFSFLVSLITEYLFCNYKPIDNFEESLSRDIKEAHKNSSASYRKYTAHCAVDTKVLELRNNSSNNTASSSSSTAAAPSTSFSSNTAQIKRPRSENSLLNEDIVVDMQLDDMQSIFSFEANCNEFLEDEFDVLDNLLEGKDPVPAPMMQQQTADYQQMGMQEQPVAYNNYYSRDHTHSNVFELVPCQCEHGECDHSPEEMYQMEQMRQQQRMQQTYQQYNTYYVRDHSHAGQELVPCQCEKGECTHTPEEMMMFQQLGMQQQQTQLQQQPPAQYTYILDHNHSSQELVPCQCEHGECTHSPEERVQFEQLRQQQLQHEQHKAHYTRDHTHDVVKELVPCQCENGECDHSSESEAIKMQQPIVYNNYYCRDHAHSNGFSHDHTHSNGVELVPCQCENGECNHTPEEMAQFEQMKMKQEQRKQEEERFNSYFNQVILDHSHVHQELVPCQCEHGECNHTPEERMQFEQMKQQQMGATLDHNHANQEQVQNEECNHSQEISIKSQQNPYNNVLTEQQIFSQIIRRFFD